MFINIQNNCSNKKILELTSDILNSLNGVKVNKKSDLQTLTMVFSSIILEKRKRGHNKHKQQQQ